jgi:hypothetical protein
MKYSNEFERGPKFMMIWAVMLTLLICGVSAVIFAALD